MSLERGRLAFERACRLDVQVRKPGNVSLASSGHRMHAQLFIASAEAAQQPLFAPGLTVGQRIERAIAATLEVAGCNTNLGIVLLAAPIAAALEREPLARGARDVRSAITRVLNALTVDDARAAYRAIALARPAGLGRSPEQDVHDEPTIDLRAAMALAAGRDSIARQYAEGFADLFEVGVPSYRAGGAHADAAVQRAYLAFLARWPDSHIVRKHGEAAAHTVMQQARPWQQRAERGEVLDNDPGFAAWDDALKRQGINPGTSADLTVAAAMLAEITLD